MAWRYVYSTEHFEKSQWVWDQSFEQLDENITRLKGKSPDYFPSAVLDNFLIKEGQQKPPMSKPLQEYAAQLPRRSVTTSFAVTYKQLREKMFSLLLTGSNPELLADLRRLTKTCPYFDDQSVERRLVAFVVSR